MGKEEFLRELGFMLNGAGEETPRAEGGHGEVESEPAARADSATSVTKRLSKLEKESRALKQQMEIMKSKMQEVTNLQKQTPTVPKHGHAELEEAIEKSKTIPAHGHSDLRKSISDLISRYDDDYKTLRNTLNEHKSRIDNLEITKEDKKEEDNRSFMGRFIPSTEYSK